MQSAEQNSLFRKSSQNENYVIVTATTENKKTGKKCINPAANRLSEQHLFKRNKKYTQKLQVFFRCNNHDHESKHKMKQHRKKIRYIWTKHSRSTNYVRTLIQVAL